MVIGRIVASLILGAASARRAIHVFLGAVIMVFLVMMRRLDV